MQALRDGKDREAWRAAVHGAAKSQTRLSDRTTTIHLHMRFHAISFISLGMSKNRIAETYIKLCVTL